MKGSAGAIERLGGVFKFVLTFLPSVVLGFVVSFFVSGVAALGVAAIPILGVATAFACLSHNSACGLLLATTATLLFPPLGLLAVLTIEGGATAITNLLSGSTLQQAAFGFALGLAVGSVLPLGVRAFCRTRRVLCYSATKFPETSASYAKVGGARGRLLTVDRTGAASRRGAALAEVKPRAGFDRDEFPPAFTKQGGAGALVTYVAPAENRAAGALFGHWANGLREGQRFIFLVTDLPTQARSTLYLSGAAGALLTRPAAQL